MKFTNLAISTVVVLLTHLVARGAGEPALFPANAAPTNSKSGNAEIETVPKAVLASATSTASPSASLVGSVGQSMDTLNDKRPLGIGDKVSFLVVEDETPPVAVQVTDSGEMEVPYLGRVMATDKTCKQLAYQIKSLLEKEFYYHATVLIGLDLAGNKVMSRGKIYVMGQVRAPGPQEIPMDEVYTVSKAILRAGGFAPYANKRKVKLVKGGTSRGDTETVIVDLVEILEKGKSNKDIEVQAEDLIIVPEKWINF